MAGVLPGAKVARRRRFHPRSILNYGSGLSESTSGYDGSSTRHPSFCLYATNHDLHLCSSSSMRNPLRQVLYDDESSLGAEAREARKRLDERLQGQRKLDTKRTSNGKPRLRSLQELEYLHSEEPKWKKKSWLKLITWKSSKREECAVCLEQLTAAVVGETLIKLRCGHRFHTNCLVPWLEASAHCPCCRMEISS